LFVKTFVQDAMKTSPPNALKLLMELLQNAGPSGKEMPSLRYIEKHLRTLRLPGMALRYDNAHKRIGQGEVGNLLVILPGTQRGQRRLLCAHVDVVDMVAGCQPVIRGKRVVPKGGTALGGDNCAGAAAILYALTRIGREKLPHPPLSIAFTVQEEAGLQGARCLDYAMLKKPDLGFVFDGDHLDLCIAAPYAFKFSVEIRGLASHAGDRPDKGISAALIFAHAVEELRKKRLWGDIRDVSGRRLAASNIGFVKGGEAVNVVMPRLSVVGEARSHSRPFLQRLTKIYEKSFIKAASKIRNAEGIPGRVRYRREWTYPGFALPENAACIRIAEHLLRRQGHLPRKLVEFGALDANFLNYHGIPTVALGCGVEGAHSTAERVIIPEFLKTCEVALGVCLGAGLSGRCERQPEEGL
jgi:tripeptide aminopeptidase